MKYDLDLKVVHGVVTLLCQHAAMHEDFFFQVVKEMHRRGYNLECYQWGVHGTYIRVVRQP